MTVLYMKFSFSFRVPCPTRACVLRREVLKIQTPHADKLIRQKVAAWKK